MGVAEFKASCDVGCVGIPCAAQIPHPCLSLGDCEDKSVVKSSRRGCRSTRNDDLFARSRSRGG